jgi:hypothetical protein
MSYACTGCGSASSLSIQDESRVKFEIREFISSLAEDYTYGDPGSPKRKWKKDGLQPFAHCYG